MPTWLITGGTGFLGRHLIEAIEHRREPGIDVVALGRRPPAVRGPVRFVPADLTDPVGVHRAIAATAPDVVFHLAGQTPPAPPEAFDRGNTRATVHLLDALRARGAPVRVVLAGSAAELGPVPPEHLPVSEEYPCRPADTYGVSKWQATAAGLAARPPLEVMVARIFNPVGPGLPTTQALGRFAAALATPEPDPLRLTVGDLDTRRDFVDARDVARAMIALADRGRAGRVYHVGTGQSQRIGDGLDQLVRLSGREVVIEINPRHENRGPDDSRADITRIINDTGWHPAIAWQESLEELWRETRTTLSRGRPVD